MKKVLNMLTAMLISIMFLLQCGIVMAETTNDEINISVKDCSARYDASTAKEHDIRYVNNVAYFSVAYNDYIIYDVTLPASGRYEIAVISGYSSNVAAKAAIQLYDNNEYKEVIRKDLEISGSYSKFIPTKMGYIDLKAGENKIKYFHIKTDTHVAGITLKRVGEIPEDIITVKPGDMSGGSATLNTDSSYITFNTANKADFSVKAKKGKYKVKFLASDYTRSKVSVFAHGHEYSSVINEQTATLSEYAMNEAGFINLEEGTNQLTIRHSGVLNTFFRLDEIILERVGDKDSALIEGEIQSVNSSLINVSNGGYYKVTAENSGNENLLTFFADGEPCGNAKGGLPCYIYLKNGEYIFKASDKDGNEFSSFVFEKMKNLTKAIEEEFISKINASGNGEDVYEALAQFEDVLKIDLDSYFGGFGAKEVITSKMASKSYGSLTEILNELSSLAEKEENAPHIQLFLNNKKVNQMTEGRYKIVIDTSYFEENITAVIAVYSGKRMKMIDFAEGDANEKAELEIDINNGETYKLLIFENIENAYPSDEENGIYRKIYVSQKAADGGDGTRLKPYKTINEALEKISEINSDMTGDIEVILDAETFEIRNPITLGSEHSGKNGHDVIFKGENAVISGGVKVTGWEPYKDGIYRATFDTEEVRNLYVDGFPAIRAKSEFTYRCETFDGNVITTSKKYLHSFNNVDDLELVFSLVWETQRLPVTDINISDNAQITVDALARGQAMNLNYQINPSAYDYFYIENALELLDEEGEFYYDKDEKFLYYYPFENDNINDSVIVVPKSEGLLNIDGAKNITFDGISFMHGAWNYVSEFGFVGTQSSFAYDIETGEGMIIPAQITINDAENINFGNCVFSCLGSSAINYVDNVKNSYIRGSLFADISASAVTVGNLNHGTSPNDRCEGLTFENNVFKRIAIEYRNCPGIGVYYERDIKILNNDFDTLPYSGISLGWGWGGYDPTGWGGFVVSNNSFKNIMQTLDDGGGVYTMGRQNSVIKENVFENFGFINYSAALHFDSGSANIKAYDNVIKNLDQWVMISAPAVHDNELYSNYINTESSIVTTTEVSVRDNILHGGKLPDEAMAICEKAGVAEKYEYLKDMLKLPSYRKTMIYDTPNRMNLPGTIYEAEDYKDHSMYGVVFLKDSLGYNPTAWTEYDVYADREGDYKLTLYAAKIISGSSVGTAEIYVNNKKVSDVSVYGTGAAWTDYLTFESGNIHLKEGANKIKIHCANSSFHIDCFALSYVE